MKTAHAKYLLFCGLLSSFVITFSACQQPVRNTTSPSTLTNSDSILSAPNPVPTVTVTVLPSGSPQIFVSPDPSPLPSASPSPSPSPAPVDYSQFQTTLKSAKLLPAPIPTNAPSPAPSAAPSILPGSDLSTSVQAVRDLNYGTCLPNQPCVNQMGDPAQLLDMYYPLNPGTALPTILFVNKGGWNAGSKTGIETKCQGVAGYDKAECQCPVAIFARRGYAVACMNHHLTVGTNSRQFPAQIQDVKTAVRFLRANAGALGVDPKRVAVFGVASGAYLAAMVGTTAPSAGVTYPVDFEGPLFPGVSSAVQAVVDYSGFTDLTLPTQPAVMAVIDLLLPNARAALATGDRSLFDQANPIKYLNARSAPFFIIHGMGDWVIPFESSQNLFTALEVLKNQGVRIPYTALKQPQLSCAQAALFPDDPDRATEISTCAASGVDQNSERFPMLSYHPYYYRPFKSDPIKSDTIFDWVATFLSAQLI